MISRLTRDRQLPAGVVDAGIASLATFASGLTGVNLLKDSDIGVYGVFFTAFILGGILVSELIYVPAQVVAVGQPLSHRLDVLRPSIRLALIPSVGAATAALLAALLQRNSATAPVLVALTATTGATIMVSALQDHIRRMLHIAERSWRAATVSVAQLLGVAVAIPALIALDINRAWIPFGSLFLANSVSLTAGLFLAHIDHLPQIPRNLRFRSLTGSGKWLVVRAAAPSAAAFFAANIVTALAGPVAYGHAEAARQVAQPVTVLALGLGAVMGPRAVRAGMDVDTAAARRTRRGYTRVIVLATTGYLLVAGFGWSLNPMSRLVPVAYQVPWLVTATVVANGIAALVVLPVSELLGAGRARLLASLTAISSPALLAAAATAGSTGAFARPIGFIVEGLLALYVAHWWLRRHYASDDPAWSLAPSPPHSTTSL